MILIQECIVVKCAELIELICLHIPLNAIRFSRHFHKRQQLKGASFMAFVCMPYVSVSCLIVSRKILYNHADEENKGRKVFYPTMQWYRVKLEG